MTTNAGMKDVLAPHAATMNIAAITAEMRPIRTLRKLAATAATPAAASCRKKSLAENGEAF
jgi:hypothetical protein